MCPPSPALAARQEIDAGSTDEEIALFLGSRGHEDPLPSNVIAGVNPFSIDPRNSPVGIWFLSDSRGSQSQNQDGIIKASNGYWSSIEDQIIPTQTPTVGRKTTMEFYAGRAPSGEKTCWRMHEYLAEKVACKGNNEPEVSSSLCRFFLRNDESVDRGEQCERLPCYADSEDLEALLLSLTEQEDRNPASRVCEDEQKKQVSCSKPIQCSINDNPMEGVTAGNDLSMEDFLELKDLYDPESSSTSFDNSSLISLNSDEYFDAEALLRDIKNDGHANMDKRVDHKFSSTTSAIAGQVVIQQPSPAFINSSNLVVNDDGHTNPIPANNPSLPSHAGEPHSGFDVSASGSSRGSHGSASNSASSQGENASSQRSRSKSIRRMAKLGRNCCCFRGAF